MTSRDSAWDSRFSFTYQDMVSRFSNLFPFHKLSYCRNQPDLLYLDLKMHEFPVPDLSVEQKPNFILKSIVICWHLHLRNSDYFQRVLAGNQGSSTFSLINSHNFRCNATQIQVFTDFVVMEFFRTLQSRQLFFTANFTLVWDWGWFSFINTNNWLMNTNKTFLNRFSFL